MRRKNGIRLLVWAMLAVLFVFAVQRLRALQRDRDEFRRDKLSDVALVLAGAGATDCGRVAKGSPVDGEYDIAQQQEVVDGCAVAALKAHKPFIARFDMQNSLSAGTLSYEAYAGTRQGQLYVLSTSQPNLVDTFIKKPISNPRIVQANGHNQLR